MTAATYYRYTDLAFEDGLRLILEEFVVLRRTPRGAWLAVSPDGQRFVRDGGRKRFAHESRSLALTSYYLRKLAHLRHLQRDTERVRRALELAVAAGAAAAPP